MRETTALDLSQRSRPDTQISIYVRMNVGNISNKDACIGLSCYILRCSLLVRLCVLSGNTNNSRGHFLLKARSHPVFLEMSGGVVIF